MMSLVWLILGFALLVWGADWFVNGASSLAKRLGVPSLIIGLTVVAFGTSAPELAVSVSASLAGENEIALGNVLGSNLFNLLMVVGLSAMVAKLMVDRELIRRDWVATIFATVVLLGLMVADGAVSQLDGVVLLVGFGGIMALQIRSAWRSRELAGVEEEGDPSKMIKIAGYIVVGLACIIAGGQISVYGATELARMFGLSETVIGLTIVAVGTSLPELVTSVVATRRGENSIAIGNVIGSNLFNILFILGVTCAINPITVAVTTYYDTAILLLVSVGMFVLAKLGKLNRLWGVVMVLCYASYTAWLLVR